MPDKVNLEEIRERESRATKGPWTSDRPAIDPNTGFQDGVVIAWTYGRQAVYAYPPGGQYPAADRDFIAHARQDIPDLLELVDQLSTWTPGLPPSPGTYAVRTIGAKMLAVCMEISKPEGDWSTLEWVKLPE